MRISPAADLTQAAHTDKWRHLIKAVHPAADLFPLMEGAEFAALVEDIRRHDLRIPLTVWEDETGTQYLLDGRNRLRALIASGRELHDYYFHVVGHCESTRDPYAYVLSANMHRRHLDAEQRREIIANVLKAQPKKSNRTIAKQTKTDHKTVGAVRNKLEVGGEIPHHDLREDARGTKQPATKRQTSDRYSVQEWTALSKSERKRIVTEANGASHFNAQESDSIEWARWSWNPITGCLHNCAYCYARDIATVGPTVSAFPNGFEPTFLPYRLTAPANTKVPDRAAQEIGYRNVFVCSMADLFGKWVPDEWIDAVFDQVRAHPQWNFLFLTKFPQRLAEREWPANAWCGTTVDTQTRVKIAERAFRDVKAGVRWLSVEPMMERLTFTSLEMFNWIVVGGATKSTQTPAFDPPMEWVLHLLGQVQAAGIEKIYAKANLRALRGYPSGAHHVATDSGIPESPRRAAS